MKIKFGKQKIGPLCYDSPLLSYHIKLYNDRAERLAGLTDEQRAAVELLRLTTVMDFDEAFNTVLDAIRDRNK